VSDYQLKPVPALGGYQAEISGILIDEVTDLSIVSITVPLIDGGRKALEDTMMKAYGVAFPAPGSSTLSKDGNMRFLGMAPDQIFALLLRDDMNADLIVSEKLQGTGYVTLQSDNWVTVRVSGANARAALARICQIDLDPEIFTVGAVTRTVMEHMGAVVLRVNENAFLLLSVWSSARSFLHAVETSARNVS